MLTAQTIRKNITIYIDGDVTDKQRVLDLSKDWTEKQESFFRKMLKQGGEFKVNGVPFKVELNEEVVNSKGEKDPGVIVFPE